MPAGKFLVGVRNEAAVYDRQQASIEVSREHASFFVQNMVAILCEERLALACYHGSAFIYGTLAATGS
jgi:HK97 family phage major capsid protein